MAAIWLYDASISHEVNKINIIHISIYLRIAVHRVSQKRLPFNKIKYKIKISITCRNKVSLFCLGRFKGVCRTDLWLLWVIQD